MALNIISAIFSYFMNKSSFHNILSVCEKNIKSFALDIEIINISYLQVLLEECLEYFESLSVFSLGRSISCQTDKKWKIFKRIYSPIAENQDFLKKINKKILKNKNKIKKVQSFLTDIFEMYLY